MKIIASYGLCNTASVNVYDVRYGIEDEVLAGINDQEPEWCQIDYNEDECVFRLGELEVPLNECIRV